MGIVRVNVKTATGATDPDVGLRISKKAGEEVLWESLDRAYVVCFKDQISPFEKHEFLIDEKGAVLSGPVRDRADLGPYQYDVVDPEKKSSVCPTIFVDP